MNIRVVLLSLFSVVNILEAANNETDIREPEAANENADAEKPKEDKLLHEIFNDKLKEAGINCPLSFSGCLNFTSYVISKDVDDKKDKSESMLEGRINFKYSDKIGEFLYGAEVMVKAGSGFIKDGSPIVRDSYIFLGTEEIGTLKLGYTKSAAHAFTINYAEALVGYGGADSCNFPIFYNESAGTILDAEFPNHDSRAAKIVYLSPKLAGFTFGLSFTPDSRDATLFKTKHLKRGSGEVSEEDANRLGSTTSYSKNIVTGGVAYEFGDKDGLNAKISAGVWIGKGKSTIDRKKVDNIRAYSIGAVIEYEKFKLSLGYIDCGKSLLSKHRATADITTFNEGEEYRFSNPAVGPKDGADAGKIYTVGLAYSFDKLAVSVGYFKSIVKFSGSEKAKADIISLAAEYSINKTVSIYAEYDNISTNTCARAQAYRKACDKSTTGKNKANIYMIGTKINL